MGENIIVVSTKKKEGGIVIRRRQRREERQKDKEEREMKVKENLPLSTASVNACRMVAILKAGLNLFGCEKGELIMCSDLYLIRIL